MIMFYTQIIIILICPLLLLFVPWKWPLMRLLPTAYLKSQTLRQTNASLGRKQGNHPMQNLVRGSEFRKAFDFLGEAVFIKDIKEWKQDKKLTHGFFKESHFQTSMPKIIQHTLEQGLVPVLRHASEHNQVLDLQEVFTRYMIDATCLMATGSNMASVRVGFPHCPLMQAAMDNMADAVFWRNVLPERAWKLQSFLNIRT
ncbi:alkane hydroxylase MAH1-like [Salvia splendens]|uniref:alkane hydroxylase MAH1-like n=1 Tax=Salvia splendens TaxID=180675 RepID=UPI0011038098|nr:alkane hydroxylase MAH1-like [Salvia splendens]